jgi:hypothetical protein
LVKPTAFIALFLSITLSILALADQHETTQKQAYFGDLHIHTRYSYDAFFFGTLASPDDAYRFAKGEPIPHASGRDVVISQPLDFYAVTDHAFFLGVWWTMKTDRDHPMAKEADVRAIVDNRNFGGAYTFDRSRLPVDTVRSAWKDVQAAAERHNDPGNFTTFIAFEFTPDEFDDRPGLNNLHRNIIYRGSRAPDMPISRIDTINPEVVWDWLDRYRDEGMDAIAIPHNMNISGGRGFELATFDGSPLTAAYAEKRMRHEPLVEITQIKGSSDTHPFLSPNDEWADFEIAPYKLGGFGKITPQGSFVRDAWKRGLMLQEEQGFNPYRFGVVAASDTHGFSEQSFDSTFTGGDQPPVSPGRGSIPVSNDNGSRGYLETPSRYYGGSGVTGVWAEANTRDAIFEALRRKETFGTSGPRVRVRFAAGYDAGDAASDSRVPQGGDLKARATSPEFLVWALADPNHGALQRMQVIKGWYEDGKAQEKVFDVACSDGLAVDPATRRCPDNGARVDLATCAVSEGVGAGELRTTWTDPEFQPTLRAFYYVRVLENPSCRWSTWDAIRAGVPPRPDLAATTQERAWSSPIWVEPSSSGSH